MATTPPYPMYLPVKRKSSTAGPSSNGQTVKRRASKACHNCHSRKVRCDVVKTGIPCTNCKLDEVGCAIHERKRRSPNSKTCDRFSRTSIEEENELQKILISADAGGLYDVSPALYRAVPDSTPHAPQQEPKKHTPHILYQTQKTMSSVSDARAPRQRPQSVPLLSRESTRPEISLPPYIHAIPNSIANEDLVYLQKKGTFIIPPAELQNELLLCYTQYVHPYFPLIDVQGFRAAIEKNDGTHGVSLLLFQAVMFAGVAYVDMRFLIAQGYVSRTDARKSFFQRVKALYQSDYEVERITLLQAVLLMTYYYENPDDQKDILYWLAVAISLARAIGLDHDTSNASAMSQQQRHLRKRIWWSCLIRDRLIAIGMRRPVQINNDDFDTPMLEISDFEIEPLPAEVTGIPGECPAAKDMSKRVTLAKMCIHLAKLCLYIGRVLAVQYCTSGRKIDVRHETTERLVPKASPTDLCDVIQCNRELDQWYQELPPEFHYFAPNSRQQSSPDDDKVINSHRALLAGVYFTAVSALHRPHTLTSTRNLLLDLELRELSKRKVEDAANKITDMYKDLYDRDLVRYLPNTGVTCLLPAAVVHLLGIKSEDPDTRQASMHKFEFCIQVLQRLREIYNSANYAIAFLSAAIRRTKVQIPWPDMDQHKPQPNPYLLMPPGCDMSINPSSTGGSAPVLMGPSRDSQDHEDMYGPLGVSDGVDALVTNQFDSGEDVVDLEMHCLDAFDFPESYLRET